jgi:hypothetical protein
MDPLYLVEHNPRENCHCNGSILAPFQAQTAAIGFFCACFYTVDMICQFAGPFFLPRRMDGIHPARVRVVCGIVVNKKQEPTTESRDGNKESAASHRKDILLEAGNDMRFIVG